MSYIGKKSKSRAMWQIKPVTRVKKSKKNYNRKNQKIQDRKRVDESMFNQDIILSFMFSLQIIIVFSAIVLLSMAVYRIPFIKRIIDNGYDEK